MAEYLDIYVREKGTDTVKRNLDSLVNSAQKATHALRIMQNALFVIGGAGVISAIGRMIDATTNFENRLQLVTKSQKEFNFVQKEVYNIASRTRSNFEATAQTYTRTALAVRSLGFSQKETLKFTELLNQAVILSGTNTKESGAALLQLSQGLSSGRLQGDELRSVLEQIPYLADLIGKELVRVGKISGATLNNMGEPVDKLTGQLIDVRGQLRQFGRDGQITTKIIFDSVLNAEKELQSGFSKTVSTIGQSFEVLRTELLRLADTFEDTFGIGESFANVVIALANNIPLISSGVMTTVSAFAALQIGKKISEFSSFIQKNKELRDAIASGNLVLLDSNARAKERSSVMRDEAYQTSQNIKNQISDVTAKKQSILIDMQLAQQAKDSVVISKSKRYARDAETGAFLSYRNAVEQVISASVRQSSLQREAITLSKELAALRIAEVAALGSLSVAQRDLDVNTEKSNRTLDKIKRYLPGLALEIDSVVAGFSRLGSLAASNPYSAIAAGLVAVGVAVYTMSDQIEVGSKKSGTTLKDYILGSLDVLKDEISSWGTTTSQYFEDFFSDVSQGAETFVAYFGEDLESLAEKTKSLTIRMAEGFGNFFSYIAQYGRTTFSQLGYELASYYNDAKMLPSKFKLGTASLLEQSGFASQGQLDSVKSSARENILAGNIRQLQLNRIRNSSSPNKNQSFPGDTPFTPTLEDRARERASARKFVEEKRQAVKEKLEQDKASLAFLNDLKQLKDRQELLKIKDPRERAIQQSLQNFESKLKRPLTGQEKAKVYLQQGAIYDLEQQDMKKSKSSKLGKSLSKEEASLSSQGPTFNSSIDELKQENFLLSLNSTEREKANRVLEIQDSIKRKLTQAEIASVNSLVEENTKLQNKNNLLAQINEPLESYRQQLEALKSLQSEISKEKFSEELAKINIELLKTKKDPASGLKRAKLQIKEASKDLASDVEEVYTSLSEVQDKYAMRLQSLNYLHSQAAITQKQYNEELIKTKIAYLDNQTTYEAGIERGLLKLAQIGQDQASAIEAVFTNAFSSISDSIADLVVDGKANFSDLVKSIQKDLIRMYSNQLFSNLAGMAGASLFGGSPMSTLPSGYSASGASSYSSLSTNTGMFVNTYAEGGIAGVNVAKFSGNGGITSGGIPAVLHPNEAVIPLSRGRKIPVELGQSNSSGVKVNIYNQSGGEATTTRSKGADGSEIIDIIIEKTKNSISSDIFRGGSTINRSIESRYGLNSSAGITR